MATFNKIILMGNLTRDPEIRYNPSGKAVASFGIAVNSKQGGQDKADFFDVIAWEKTAELCSQYLNKGDSALIEGKLTQRRWETDDGQKRNKVEIVAFNVQFMGKRQSESEDEGDIPF